MAYEPTSHNAQSVKLSDFRRQELDRLRQWSRAAADRVIDCALEPAGGGNGGGDVLAGPSFPKKTQNTNIAALQPRGKVSKNAGLYRDDWCGA